MMDEQIMNLYNKMLMLEMKRDKIESRDYLSVFKPDKPEMDVLPELWLIRDEFEETYDKIFKEYYDFSYKPEEVNLNTVKKYYPEYDPKKILSVMCEIGPKGKPDNRNVSHRFCTYTYKGPSFGELNQVKDSIVKERGKLFKNPFKLKKLIEKHKELRKSLAEPYQKLTKVCLDKVFLNTFSHRLGSGGSVVRDLFLCNVGWLSLPPFFFNDSLYNLNSGKYKKLQVTTYIQLLPEASLALITKDLQAESGDTFFKKGVTYDDLLTEVKKQAEYERKFAKKFTLEFVCSLLNEKLKTYNPKNKNQGLTVKLPYMGLDKLDDNGLKAVADRIWHYYSLIDRYGKYENWFNNYPMANYLKKMESYYNATGGSATMADWEREVALVLPAGKKDVAYFNTYMNAIKTNRFATYYDLCKYVEDIRLRDELHRTIKNIETTQKKIEAQNNTIISNQQQLYLQAERHHKEKMKQAILSHNAIIKKLEDIEDTLEAGITIYY